MTKVYFCLVKIKETFKQAVQSAETIAHHVNQTVKSLITGRKVKAAVSNNSASKSFGSRLSGILDLGTIMR